MKKRGLLIHITFLTFVILFMAACGSSQPTHAPISRTVTASPIPPTIKSPQAVAATSEGPDYWPTSGWQTTTPEEQGMDSEMLAKMLEHIQDKDYDIHSVTLVRNGYLVADAVIYPFKSGSKHNIFSCTKSIISALIGIAIEQGYIESVKQPVLSFFPAQTADNLDASKEAMTLEHLLMMASGLDCRDSYIYRWQGMDPMLQTNDWVQHVLDLPMAVPPGTWFEYCNGTSFLLSAIIQETTGMSAAAFAETNLFSPLGITDMAWPANPQGITIGWSDLRLQPHDMAKIGYLYLQEGRWEGQQIIPADWVAASSRKQISATLQDGYGYQWWVEDDGLYMASGFAGQFIFVLPELELVVVFTSNLGENDPIVLENLLRYFIIPAAESSKPLPANTEGLEMLESSVQQAAQKQAEPEPVHPLPETAQKVTGQTYLLNPNPPGYQSISLEFQTESVAVISRTQDLDVAQVVPTDPVDWHKVESPVGLDNLFRFSPGPYMIPMGMKGVWESQDTFVVDTDYTGNVRRDRIRFTFQGEQIIIKIRTEGVSGETILNGRLKQ